ncbi:linear amide C-N hydrolase [Motilimonas sp. 1_MG-2023]|uniref:linear amide C-N hydrolase n=1 Tax=Motilimonas sp. 1_MG-2023 TaxID=3062672 RepID=UPI0026E34FE2|nr:linear amide C-N hydrolase [Motilimonas sp. 1_MG-2023]MDO6527598.1 linear amide C-N hydrolase [Motilimonas sp. 1_MG-2023]
MCTRILNNINKNHVTVGRNMDWEFPLQATLFMHPAHGKRVGMSATEAAKEGLNSSQVRRWKIKHATIATMVGDDINGYGFCDGMNDQGLVANALYDTICTFGDGALAENQKGLSVLCWGQFILDRFATVSEAVTFFAKDKIRLFGGKVPGDDNSAAVLHISISDKTGNSAILEIEQGLVKSYQSENYTVMTNQPDYATQLKLMDYWMYQWNKSEVRNLHPVFTVPGGYTAVQRFERGCFYRYLSNETAKGTNPVAQVRSMVATCIVPTAFEELHPLSVLEKVEKGLGYSVNSQTLWTNVSDSRDRRYYFISNENMQMIWLNMDNDLRQSKKLVISDSFVKTEFMGQANHLMEECDSAPFSYSC